MTISFPKISSLFTGFSGRRTSEPKGRGDFTPRSGSSGRVRGNFDRSSNTSPSPFIAVTPKNSSVQTDGFLYSTEDVVNFGDASTKNKIYGTLFNVIGRISNIQIRLEEYGENTKVFGANEKGAQVFVMEGEGRKIKFKNHEYRLDLDKNCASHVRKNPMLHAINVILKLNSHESLDDVYHTVTAVDSSILSIPTGDLNAFAKQDKLAGEIHNIVNMGKKFADRQSHDDGSHEWEPFAIIPHI